MNNKVKIFGVAGIIVGIIWLGFRLFYIPFSYSEPLDFVWPIVILVLGILYYKGRIPVKK